MADVASADASMITAKSLTREVLRKQRKLMILVGIAASLFFGLESLVPVVVGFIMDRAIMTGDVAAFLIGLAGLLFCYVLLIASRHIYVRHINTVGRNVSHEFRSRITGEVLDPRGKGEGVKAGELVSLTLSDADEAEFMARSMPLLFAELANVGVLLTIVLFINVWLGIGVAMGFLAFMLLWRRLAPKLADQHVANQSALAQAAALATDIIAGARILRGIGAQKSAAARYRTASRHCTAAALRLARTNAFQESLISVLSGCFLAGFIGVSGALFLNASVTAGELVIVVASLTKIVTSVNTLSVRVRIIATSKAAIRRIATSLEMLAKSKESGPVRRLRVVADHDIQLEIREVFFRSLTGISFRLRRGEIVGVLTCDPRDAAAMLDLLTYRASTDRCQGGILVQGVPWHEMKVAKLRELVLVEQHDIALFEGTLHNNLCGNNKDIEPERVMSALSATAVTDVVDTHPARLNQPVTDRGTTFSGGQRQRIGLARALLADPPILVLPEPTTAVDAVTEEIVAEGLVKFRHTNNNGALLRSTLIITSSPILLSKTDRVLVVEGGRVIDEGTHQELADRNARYRQVITR